MSDKHRSSPGWLRLAAVVILLGAGQAHAQSDPLRIAGFDQDGTTWLVAAASVAHGADQGFGKIEGRWRRPDGGYVLDIRKIRPDGAIDAAYLNPRPVNVGKAQRMIPSVTSSTACTTRPSRDEASTSCS